MCNNKENNNNNIGVHCHNKKNRIKKQACNQGQCGHFHFGAETSGIGLYTNVIVISSKAFLFWFADIAHSV